MPLKEEIPGICLFVAQVMNSFGDHRISTAVEPESRRSPRIPTAPLITIETTVWPQKDTSADGSLQDPDPSSEQLVESPSLSPQLLPQLPSITFGPRSYSNAGSASTHFHAPAYYKDNFASNVLQIPSSNTHTRSNSGSSIGSVMSGWSGWTPGPATDERASELGDPNIDARALLNTNGDSKSNHVDNPFAFTETQIGKQLYDPKNLEALRTMEGLEGLTMGLRTDVKTGLPLDEDILDGHVTLEEVWSAFESPLRRAFQREAVATNIANHDTTGLGIETLADEYEYEHTVAGRRGSQSQPFFRDRRRIFGENKIPVRPLKNIFQLMWIALHDKILVWPLFSSCAHFF